jgi:hypothetical protein
MNCVFRLLDFAQWLRALVRRYRPQTTAFSFACPRAIQISYRGLQQAVAGDLVSTGARQAS